METTDIYHSFLSQNSVTFLGHILKLHKIERLKAIITYHLFSLQVASTVTIWLESRMFSN